MLQENEELDLFLTIRNNDLRTFKLLIRSGYEINKGDENGLTPLHMACFLRMDFMAQEMLKMGCNPNVEDVNKVSPLFLAVLKSQVETCEKLM